MGTKNKQRRRRERAARYRAGQARSHSVWGPHGAGCTCGDMPRVVREALWVLSGIRVGDARLAMVDLERAPWGIVIDEAEDQLAWLIGRLWQEGWQPAELARHAGRSDPRIGRIVTAAIAADHLKRDRRSMHPQWVAQADIIAAGARPDGWLVDVVDAERFRGTMRVLLVIKAISLCSTAGSLPTILPPPGSDPATWDHDDDVAGVDDPVLAKVRALLAQAESTTFEAEAEAFTAKAQELMARHAIDSAMLWSRSECKSRPTTIRLPIDDPYADQKSLLLHFVAEHSQCRAIVHVDCGLQSVIGFAADVAATETLFTSLLVQSQAAMQAEAASAPPGSRMRSRSFRASFLEAYARRINHRLSEINRSVRDAVEAENTAEGPSILPVLVARRDAIDAEVDELFGELSKHRTRGVSDALGWSRGRLAADRAELNQSVVSSTAPELFG